METPEERLDQIFDTLVEADGFDDMGAVLSVLTDDELRDTQESAVFQFGIELAEGACERSEWLCGELVINGNQASICFHRRLLDAVKHETDRRRSDLSEPPSCGLPN